MNSRGTRTCLTTSQIQRRPWWDTTLDKSCGQNYSHERLWEGKFLLSSFQKISKKDSKNSNDRGCSLLIWEETIDLFVTLSLSLMTRMKNWRRFWSSAFRNLMLRFASFMPSMLADVNGQQGGPFLSIFPPEFSLCEAARGLETAGGGGAQPRRRKRWFLT